MMLLDVIYFILRNSLCIVHRPHVPSQMMGNWCSSLVQVEGWVVFVQEFTKHGAEVVLWDINSSSANEQTAKLVPEMGGKAHTYTVDVTNSKDALT